MKKYFVPVLLSLFIGISIFLHFFKIGEVPPCLNADEAAFGYNAYSILKTGKDEYGALLPLRLKSFEDYKLPVYSYLSVPIMAIFGLNDFSTRFLNVIIGVSFVPLMYFLARELFSNKKIALLSASLTSVNPGIFILSRHAHEGVISTFFVLLGFLVFIKYLKSGLLKHFLLMNVFLALAAFSYQTGRIYFGFFFVMEFLVLFFVRQKEQNQKRGIHLVILLIILLFTFYPDISYGVNRVKNLFFLKDSGFQLRLNEYRSEHDIRLFHNKLLESVRYLTNKYIYQLSPEFFLTNGDKNPRFGFPDLGIISPVEFLFFFAGLYFLFRSKERFRYYLLALFFVAPVANTLTWQDASLIRTYLIIFPLVLIAAFGFWHFLEEVRQKKLKIAVAFLFLFGFLFYLSNNLDLYFFHYPKRAMTIRAWQCGYRELVDYVRTNYNTYDRFIVTDRHGQPYIYFLYYLGIDPAAYQKQAKISAPDAYGFGQVGQFDKFDFKFRFDPTLRRTVFIGYPDGFNDQKIDLEKIKKIKVGTEEIFWIYEAD